MHNRCTIKLVTYIKNAASAVLARLEHSCGSSFASFLFLLQNHKKLNILGSKTNGIYGIDEYLLE